MTKLLTDQYEMIHTCNHVLWRGSIPHRLIEAGGMTLQDLDDEIARGDALERLCERLPDIMTGDQRTYLAALRRDRIQLTARGRL
ncbi:MAG TPA: hypothetical protein VGG72_08360 [Bryobacteraceae bacterium]|jgi:hypothetical protein